MLTLPSPTVRAERPAYRPYRATVARVRGLSPHFTTVTFTGADFADFGTAGPDQRITIVFPLPGVGISEFGADDPVTQREGTWYARWRALPGAQRNPLRTYTVRRIRRDRRELDVDFVVHGAAGAGAGPAARWLRTAAAGDDVVIVGPDARSGNSRVGVDWNPGGATRLLLIGDETAVPAVGSILDSLPSGRAARIFLEVPTAADALPLRLPPGSELTWLERGAAPQGSRLDTAVREWAASNREFMTSARGGIRRDPPSRLPEGDFSAWLAGEAGLVSRLRRFLVVEAGIDRPRVAFRGYWRLGKAAVQ